MKRAASKGTDIGEVTPTQKAALKRAASTRADIGEAPVPLSEKAYKARSRGLVAKSRARDEATAAGVTAREIRQIPRDLDAKAYKARLAELAAKSKATRDKAAAQARIRAADKKAADKAARDEAAADKAARDRIRAAKDKPAPVRPSEVAATKTEKTTREKAQAKIRAVAPEESAAKLEDKRPPESKPEAAIPLMKIAEGDLPPASRAEALRVAELRATTLKKAIEEPGDPVMNTMLLMTPIIGT